MIFTLIGNTLSQPLFVTPADSVDQTQGPGEYATSPQARISYEILVWHNIRTRRIQLASPWWFYLNHEYAIHGLYQDPNSEGESHDYSFF